MMKTSVIVAAAVVGLAGLVGDVAGQEWKMAKSPIVTRWAKDVDPAKVLPEYPRPQMVRKEWVNLNGLWEFEKASEGGKAEAGKKLGGSILVPFPMESALSGVGQHHDHSVYRRTFEVPKGWAGQRVILHFGAVDYVAKVWVNGKEVGTHTGGYDSFEFDVTDALKADGGANELIVAVTDTTAETQARGKQTTEPRGIWYTPVSGIWQTVWIEPVPAASVARIDTTPDLEAGAVKVKVLGRGEKGKFTAVAMDGGKEVGRVEGNVGEEVALKVADAKLWTPETPHLYGLKVTLEGGDAVESYFGMRSISVGKVDGVNRLLLNGKYVFHMGPLDQGFWPDGIYTAPTDEALKYDIEITKKMGFNMLRKHVKVEPQRFYYWCDKLGILVWQDMPNAMSRTGGEWQKQFEIEMKELVDEHRSSPAIVMWVPLNEGWGQEPYAKEGTIRLTEWVKSLDPSRLVNNASGWTDSGAGDVHDIHNYPNPAAPPVEEKRAVVLGEFGGLGLPVKDHVWVVTDRNWGYQNMESKEELTERYVKLMGRLWDLAENKGLSAGVYTQTTDVETEVNGLLTYDREVIKVDVDKVHAANTGEIPRTESQIVVPTGQQEAGITWRYTTEKPADGWEKPEFDDSKWQSGPAGFGKEGTPGAVVRTKWETPDIYLRREFELPAGVNPRDLQIYFHHDENCVVYINGVQAVRAARYTTEYADRAISGPALAAMKPGKNTFAVHCRNTAGGQYIDVGLVRIVEKARK